MTSPGAMIADAATMGTSYAQRLLAGIPENRVARLAAPGGVTIQANHPAFILGHLSLYPTKILQLLEQAPADAAPPSRFTEVFAKDATCQDDPEGTIYPSFDEIVTFFTRSHAAAIPALRHATQEQLDAPNPVETPMRKVCPTLGGLLNFYATSHVMIHLGQLSTWRRMEGLPPA